MMTEMDKKINEFKCVSFKEIYLRTKIVNELKFMYTRYRNDLDCDYSPIGPILKKEDSDYLEKLRKEFVEIIFKRDDLKKEIIKEYKIDWKEIWEYKNKEFNEGFNVEFDNAWRVFYQMKEDFAYLLQYSYTDDLQQEFAYLYYAYISDLG